MKGTVRAVKSRGGVNPTRMTNRVFSNQARMILSTSLWRMMRLSTRRKVKEAR